MRIAMRIVLLAAAWLSLFIALPAAAAPSFPALTGRVTDEAGILSEDTRDKLTSMLAQQEQQTGVQLAVVTVKSLQGYDIQDYGYQLGRKWGIGQKGKDNGALLIIAPNERKMRIEVGYGLEGQLTDAQSKLIIAEIITPFFKRGDYDGGVMAGTTAMLKTIGGATINPDEYAPAQGYDDSGRRGNPIGMGIIPIILLVILFWIGGWRFVAGLLLGSMLGGGRGYGGGGWGGGGGWSGGGGGGGFSGGGGSFGGGGASGGW
jgi:uncharacterized protein